jgi:hypothetical protein
MSKINLNTCVPGQKVRLRDGEIVKYDGPLNENTAYTHAVNGYSYMSNGDYWQNGALSGRDVVEILPLEKENKPITDLRTCVPGQKLRLRDGRISIYKKASGLIDYPHLLNNDKFYTDEGCYYRSKAVSPHDVMEILPMKCKPVTDLRTCVPGQKLRLRDGRISIYKKATDSAEYPHQTCSGGTYTAEGYYWLDKCYSNNDVMEILPLEEEPAKTPTELTHSITDQIDVTNPDHVSIIPHQHGVTISIKKGLTTISWRHYNN